MCQLCPMYGDDRCESPAFDEEQVRKWDGIILKELGISYGQRMTSEEIRNLIDRKAPLNFCQNRCRLREECNFSEHK